MRIVWSLWLRCLGLWKLSMCLLTAQASGETEAGTVQSYGQQTGGADRPGRCKYTYPYNTLHGNKHVDSVAVVMYRMAMAQVSGVEGLGRCTLSANIPLVVCPAANSNAIGEYAATGFLQRLWKAPTLSPGSATT